MIPILVYHLIVEDESDVHNWPNVKPCLSPGF